MGNWSRNSGALGDRALAVGGAFAVQFSEFAEADEFFVLLVPKAEGEGFEAGPKGDSFYALEKGMGFVATLEVVIGDAGAQVVNVVETDVAGEPLKYFGQFVERTSLEGGSGEIPLFVAFPINSLELVLDVEEPNASGTGDGNYD